MPRFLIEVPHESEVVACARVVQIFLTSGSHFLTNAEWAATTAITIAGWSSTWAARRRRGPSCRRGCGRSPGSFN